jgi:RecQ family ATP-dependent DNA helicase
MLTKTNTPVSGVTYQQDPPNALIMMWAGFATTRLKVTLMEFQKKSLYAAHCGKDSVVIQSTGSGKSLCFQLPALMIHPNSTSFVLVIVPTLALGQDHLENLKKLDIDAVFLSSSTTKEDRDVSLRRSSTSTVPAVVILTAETLFGDGLFKGFLSQMNREQVKLIVIDEAHIIYEWAQFRSAMDEIQTLRSLFVCPITAMTATIKPAHLIHLKTSVLRTPVVIKGNIDRPNVEIHVLPYFVMRNTKNEEIETKEKWKPVAVQIADLVNGEITIVYCAYTKECEKIHFNLMSLGIDSACYTGSQTTAKEKIDILGKMKRRAIQILVATKAFGMGVNIPNIRNVVHVGIPENMSSWVQEIGRAGRDGKSAKAFLLINEFYDLKRLKFWTFNVPKKAADERTEDFKVVWSYIASAFIGSCLRCFQLNYFENDYPLAELHSQDCCVGCFIRELPVAVNTENIGSVLQCVNILSKLGKSKEVYESKIISWISGKEEHWLWTHFNKEDLIPEKQPTFGLLKEMSRTKSKVTVQGIVRQCFALNYLTINFEQTGSSQTMNKTWQLTDLGCQVINKTIKPPSLPDPLTVTQLLLKKYV